MQRLFSRLILLLGLLAPCAVGQTASPPNAIELPSLGDSSSALFSARQEYELGQLWLMRFRGQAPLVDDPLLQTYLENLVYELVTHSELQDRRLSVVAVDNPTVNAFAVPGGVIGVHNGLLLQAAHEDELAAVLSHELAHLSQRHFARGVEAARRQQLPTLAGMLASLVLAATAGPDAGMAAMAATQAAGLQSRLRYSRQHEQEADRIGMRTLVASGRDPYAAARMFSTLQRLSRFSGPRPPEFLLSHPVTESRISDVRSRAANYTGRMAPGAPPEQDLDYQLVRARIRLHFEESPSTAVRNFRARLDNAGDHDAPARYGLALALLEAGQPEAAAETLAPLLAEDDSRIPYVMAHARIQMHRGRGDDALAVLEKHLQLNPGNHPLTVSYVDVLTQLGQHAKAETVLSRHVRQYPDYPSLWYRLAELNGLNGHIRQLHQSRAEYFVLTGQLDRATQQLEYAERLANGNHLASEVIRQRRKEVAEIQAALQKVL